MIVSSIQSSRSFGVIAGKSVPAFVKLLIQSANVTPIPPRSGYSLMTWVTTSRVYFFTIEEVSFLSFTLYAFANSGDTAMFQFTINGSMPRSLAILNNVVKNCFHSFISCEEKLLAAGKFVGFTINENGWMFHSDKRLNLFSAIWSR